MKKNKIMYEFNDALLICLFATEDREDTIRRLTTASDVITEKDFRTGVRTLARKNAKMDDYGWAALCQMTRWNMDSILSGDRSFWDGELEEEDDHDDDDEDETPDQEASETVRTRAPYEVR